MEVEEFKKEVDAIGLEFVGKDELNIDHLRMEIDIDTEVDYSQLVGFDLVMKRMTKRNEPVYVKLESYQDNRLTFAIIQPCPEKVREIYSHFGSKLIGTTFMDFCWYHSEGTSDVTAEEIGTKFREDAEKGNLTWHMPVHACDNLVEVMHVLNQSFLEGVLEESIIYGVQSVARQDQ